MLPAHQTNGSGSDDTGGPVRLFKMIETSCNENDNKIHCQAVTDLAVVTLAWGGRKSGP